METKVSALVSAKLAPGSEVDDETGRVTVVWGASSWAEVEVS